MAGPLNLLKVGPNPASMILSNYWFGRRVFCVCDPPAPGLGRPLPTRA